MPLSASSRRSFAGGGDTSAQPASALTRSATAALQCSRAPGISMQLQDEPVELRRHTKKHSADDVQQFDVVRIYRALPACARRHERILILAVEHQLDRKAPLGHWRDIRQIAADRKLTLRGRPHDRIDLA